MNKRIFITGIGTEVGKTVTSAILLEAWKADYWKPIQAGDLDNTDTMKVCSWVTDANIQFHKEVYRLNTPASPHYAAELDGIEIKPEEIQVPDTSNWLLIEGAGGIMVPINRHEMMLDFIAILDAEVVLVSRHYLGSINHTLLSVNALRQRNISVMGIVFNGNENRATESIIEEYSGLPILGRVEELSSISPDAIKAEAEKFKKYRVGT